MYKKYLFDNLMFPVLYPDVKHFKYFLSLHIYDRILQV